MNILSSDEFANRGISFPNDGVFESLGEEDLQALSLSGELIAVNNELLVQDQVAQEFLYVVLEGEVEIFKSHDDDLYNDNKQVFAKLDYGKCFGEMSLFTGGIATANVMSVGDATLWRINHANLMGFVAAYAGGGQLCLNLSNILSHRLIDGNSKVISIAGEYSSFVHEQMNKKGVDEASKKSMAAIEAKLADLQSSYGPEEDKTKGASTKVLGAVSVLFVVALIGCVGLFINHKSVGREVVTLRGSSDVLRGENSNFRDRNDELLDQNDNLRNDNLKNIQSFSTELKDLQKDFLSTIKAIATKEDSGSALNDLMSQFEKTQSVLEQNGEKLNELAALQKENAELKNQLSSMGATVAPRETEPEVAKQEKVSDKNRYAVMKTVRVRGAKVKHPTKKNSNGSNLYVQYPDIYVYVIVSEKAKRKELFYEVPASVYPKHTSTKNKLLTAEEVNSWKRIPKIPVTADLIEAAEKKMKAQAEAEAEAEEAAEDGNTSAGSALADKMFDQLTKGIGGE